MSDKSSDWQNAFEQECVKHANSVLCMQKKIEELKVFNARLFSDNGELEVKLQAAEEKLTECASNYWKEVEKRKAAEEENKILREAVEFYARKENWTRRGSQFRLADYGEDDGHSYRYGYLARQALEKVGKE